MGLGWLRLVLSLMVMDAHFGGFRDYLQPWIVNRFGVERLSYVGEGGIAVTGFFIISGYVIAYVIGCKYDAIHWRGIGIFYVGRILRIFPLYLLLFGAYWAVLAGLGHPPAMTTLQIGGNALLLPYGLQSLFTDFNHSGPMWLLTLIGPSWTLTLDLLLYLLAPFLFVRKSTTWVVWWLGLWYFLAFALYGDTRSPVWLAYFYAGAPPYIFAFANGALLFHYRERPAPRLGWAVLVVIALVLLTYCPLGLTNTVLNQLFAIAAFAVLIGRLTRQRKVQQRWDRFFGDLTYATYLLHVPIWGILQLLGFPYPASLTMVTTYGLATLLLHGFEYPLDRWRDRLYQRRIAMPASDTARAGLSQVLPGLALLLYLAACIWGVTFNLLGANAARSDLKLETCTSSWRCRIQADNAQLQVVGMGQASLSFFPSVPLLGRIVLDLNNQGGAGEVFAGLSILKDGQESLRVGLFRQGEQCHLQVMEPGQKPLSDPAGWSMDCQLVHRFVMDTFTGVLAVDSMWIYRGVRQGESRIDMVAGESGQGEVTVRHVFVVGR